MFSLRRTKAAATSDGTRTRCVKHLGFGFRGLYLDFKKSTPYHALFESHLRYGITAQGGCSYGNLQRIKVIQKIYYQD